MSIITLQLGQYGNQIGGQFFHLLANDLDAPLPSWCPTSHATMYAEASRERFFYISPETPNKLNARAVLVDMEPKVIAQTMDNAQKSGKWQYTPGEEVCQKRGSGNNWAHGFCQHGPRVEDMVLEAVRCEAERCDALSGFLALMSLAGGTGSGLGSFLTRSLRDHYPNCFVVNQVVWPYDKGEVAVQSYNAILSLGHLYQSADAILMAENDSLHKVCTQLLDITKVSFADINSVISTYLACMLLPASEAETSEAPSCITSHMGDLLQSVASHPEYKMLTMRAIPHISKRAATFSTYQWPGLLKHLRQMLVANAPMEEGINWQTKCGTTEAIRSLANLLILRGKDVSQADVAAFKDPRLYSSWLPADCAFTHWSHTRPFSCHEKFAALLSNSQSVVPVLDRVTERGWRMFGSRAYVHQYMKHGLEEDDFVDCFAGLEQVLASYRRL